MLHRKHFQNNGKVLVYALLTVGMFTACGRKQEDVVGDADSMYTENTVSEQGFSDVVQEETAGVSKTDAVTENVSEAVAMDGTSEAGEAAKADVLKQRFGESCISEQTFEVEFSEYDGKVWFVPYASSGEEDFHMQIIQDEEVLTDISGYVPEELEGQEFSSLDAVSFFDFNYDNMTDIVLIETYGDTSFAVVYYGEVYGYLDGPNTQYFFELQSWMTDNLADSVEELTISSIRDYLGNGKKNGEYADYREAYLAAARLYQLESNHEIAYDLIYFDDDDIPELVADCPGYHVSLYTYSNGKRIPIIDRWGYGVGGRHGYEYCPRKGSVRNYDADYAGLILYTYYFELDDDYWLAPVVSIKAINFDDANGNEILDEDEEETVGYSKLYIGDREITMEEYESYSVGAYEWLGYGPDSMSLEELTEILN